jgi:hypothetical protein
MKNQTTKILYKCIKTPEEITLQGFEKNKTYKGRAFNGLFEISEEWATHKPTYLLDKKAFDQYFQVVEQLELHLA